MNNNIKRINGASFMKYSKLFGYDSIGKIDLDSLDIKRKQLLNDETLDKNEIEEAYNVLREGYIRLEHLDDKVGKNSDKNVDYAISMLKALKSIWLMR